MKLEFEYFLQRPPFFLSGRYDMAEHDSKQMLNKQKNTYTMLMLSYKAGTDNVTTSIKGFVILPLRNEKQITRS